MEFQEGPATLLSTDAGLEPAPIFSHDRTPAVGPFPIDREGCVQALAILWVGGLTELRLEVAQCIVRYSSQ